MPSFGMVFREESENDGPEAQIALLGRVFQKYKISSFLDADAIIGHGFSRGARK